MNNPQISLNKPLEKQFKGLRRLIGNTPLLAIDFEFRGEKRTIYAKSENLNMTGSIKDRMAFYILQHAHVTGQIQPGSRIAEATSGNTGISFSALGRALGHDVIIFMPDWMSRERVELIRSLGASIVPVSKEQGGFRGSIEMAEELHRKDNSVFLPRQFSNLANMKAHEETTGPEILFQLSSNGLKLDAFVAGVGTGGTVMGVGQAFRNAGLSVKIHPLEPTESPTMSTGHKVGHHRIQGISDEFIPEIVKLDQLDSIVAVSDGDSIIMAQKLACELGLAVGVSSGANFIGALMIQNEMGKDAVVVTVFSDDNKKYLSTDLMKEEPVKTDYLAPEIKLKGFTAFKRVCQTCCELGDCGTMRVVNGALVETV
jgi:cysteine synthase A